MRNNQKTDYQAPISSGMEDSKVYRRFVASSSVDQTDNRAAWNNEMNDAFAALKVQESVGVKDREEKLPLGLRILAPLLWIAAILCCLLAYSGIVPKTFEIVLVAAAVVCVLLRILISVWKYRRDQRAWIDRVNHRE